jgi:acetoin utilization deacetylase AcuC-like enzyme
MQGRVVSVLEGGYAVGGGVVSALGRSVAAHLRGLALGTTEKWDTRAEAVRQRALCLHCTPSS